MSSLHENTLVALIALAERGVSHAESAEREADYGVPTFGPSVAEELRAQIEGLHEPLADLFKVLSGGVGHKSDCATSNAPAYMPSPCDCTPLATIPDPEAYMKAARGMREAAAGLASDVQGIVDSLSDCGEWGSECPLQDAHKPDSTIERLQRLLDALLAFDAAQGER